MAGRPPKEGIDYAGWDVDVFDNDPKIDKLLMSQGCKGFVVYFYLCQKAYGSTGYYYSWRYDDCATTAKKLGGVVGADTVYDTVRFCVQVGLFDGKLLEAGILTSRGIQRRFREVAKLRTGNKIIKDYWLLEDENNAGLNFCTRNSHFQSDNTHFQADNTHLPSDNAHKVKESKVKDSKDIKECGAAAPAPAPSDEKIRASHGTYGWVKLTATECNRLVAEYGEETVNRYIDVVDEKAQMTGNKNKWKDWNLTVRNAIKQQWGGGSHQYKTAQERRMDTLRNSIEKYRNGEDMKIDI